MYEHKPESSVMYLLIQQPYVTLFQHDAPCYSIQLVQHCKCLYIPPENTFSNGHQAMHTSPPTHGHWQNDGLFKYL